MKRRFDQLKQCSTAWMLLAVFIWIMQPVGTNLFCHDDFSHDHSAHASKTQSSGHQHDRSEDHNHGKAHDAFHERASSPAPHDASSELPKPAHAACCCQPQQTSITVAAAVSYPSSNSKDSTPSSSATVLALAYEPAAPLTASSRAGPAVPSLYSQLCRSSFSNRAPPLSI